MFLAALGFPRPEHGFDGNIGIFPVTRVKAAKRRSQYHMAGDEYEETANMDSTYFIDMVKTKVIPAAVAKVQHWAKKLFSKSILQVVMVFRLHRKLSHLQPKLGFK
tara:strand:+ start:1232 stop:1549 length:318 start_codon:yes stop_codon:yes gene_type:complete